MLNDNQTYLLLQYIHNNLNDNSTKNINNINNSQTINNANNNINKGTTIATNSTVSQVQNGWDTTNNNTAQIHGVTPIFRRLTIEFIITILFFYYLNCTKEISKIIAFK